MMVKKKSNPWARMKYLYVLPLAAFAVAAFARPEVSNQLSEISSVKVNDLTSIMKGDEVKSVEKSSEEKFKLSGQVMNVSTKQPVIGASVLVRGTIYGTLSDANGKFELQVKKGDVLMVSYVGLQTQSLPVVTESKLVVWMKDDVQSMEEMVVVGMASDGVGAPSVSHPDKKVVAVVDVPNVKEEQLEVFTVVEEMPQFPGGMGEAMRFLTQNIKYPSVAQQAKIEGRVTVQFLVGRDGSVSDVKTVRSVSPELDAEAIRVVNMMPKWIPGKQRGKAVAVRYTMPIIFRLSTPEPKKEESPYVQMHLNVEKGADKDNVDLVKNHMRSAFNGISVRGIEGKSPLIVLDGKVIGNGAEVLSKVPANQIQLLSVLKDSETAIAKYGDKAKDGVIEIITKKKQ